MMENNRLYNLNLSTNKQSFGRHQVIDEHNVYEQSYRRKIFCLAL